MARGTSRAPSQNAYRGRPGKTQQITLHVTTASGDLVPAQVYTSIDAVADPELVDRLHADTLNAVTLDSGETARVVVPVLYHDPAAELLVLVLGDAHRHRELDARIRIFEQLRDDEAPVPAYAKDFAVVFGSVGLRRYLERRAQQHIESDHKRVEREAELDRRARELDRRTAELEAARAEIEKLRSEARNRVIAQAQHAATRRGAPGPEERQRGPESAPINEDKAPSLPAPLPPPAPADDAPESNEPNTKPIEKSTIDELGQDVDLDDPINGGAVDHEMIDSGLLTGVVAALDALDKPDDGADEEPTGSQVIPPGSDPLTTETTELALDAVTDPWLDWATTGAASSFTVEDNRVRLALIAGESTGEPARSGSQAQIARGLRGALDVRLVLHRVATYPIIALVIGAPAALRVPVPGQLAVLVLDIAADRDRAVLAALGKRFAIEVELIAHAKRYRRVGLSAPLADNVTYVVRAAEDHLRGVTSDGEASFATARDLVLGPGFDLLGLDQADASEFRDDKLAQLETAQQLRRAIAIARKFARPSREDYLVCTRGFPLPRWRELRRHVLDSAVTWGLWMGPELAQVAVSEGLARSRRDLVIKLDRGFEALRRHPTAFDIDDDAAADNLKAIAEEARALGVELAKKNGALTSEEVSQVSGSIGHTPAHGIIRQKTTDELIALLDDKHQRLDSALRLCERAEAKAAAPVIAAVAKMSRSEAVRVLGMSVKFGEAAKEPLLAGLGSNKSFLRHGCALALAMLRTEDGTQSVIDLLFSEPTEIWREVARAIGQVGPSALLPLASSFGKLADRGSAMAERVAWAMAHVAVRGGKAAIETMAGGQSIVAPVARKSLELLGSAAKDQTRVRAGADGSQPGRDVTVNRAFSRRFFEALDQGIPDAGRPGLVDLDKSTPMEMLDDADLIEDEEELEQQLDESDLIRP